MSSLFVFNRVYRLEIQSVMLVFSSVPDPDPPDPDVFGPPDPSVNMLEAWIRGSRSDPHHIVMDPEH